jgi:hypothetical protein
VLHRTPQLSPHRNPPIARKGSSRGILPVNLSLKNSIK